ncbi:MAG: hypothetical protein JST26_20200 [Bacteroidetes bacterium]|nr:hypothetical protein [Bacteroidota bacterium]
MKKISFLFTAFVSAAVLFTACGKHHKATHSTQTVNATVDMNKSYQFDLGTVSKKESARITEQAQHFSVSQTASVDGTEHMVYNYTPATNYTGTDQVTIEIAEGHHQCGEHHEHHGGNCQHSGSCHHHHDNDDDDDDNTTTYIININVVRAATTPVVVTGAQTANMN